MMIWLSDEFPFFECFLDLSVEEAVDHDDDNESTDPKIYDLFAHEVQHCFGDLSCRLDIF